jgi:hypothetical protein
VRWKEFDGFGNSGGARFVDIDFMAAIVVGCVADGPAFFAMWGPRVAVGWVVMDDGTGAEGYEGALVVIGGAI